VCTRGKKLLTAFYIDDFKHAYASSTGTVISKHYFSCNFIVFYFVFTFPAQGRRIVWWGKEKDIDDGKVINR
jgi:hypothetical protein